VSESGGAAAGGPAGNSHARNSPKARVHVPTLSRDDLRVNEQGARV